MNGIKHILWDEWGSVEAGKTSKDEAAGILDGIPSEDKSDSTFFTTPRLFAVRRLMRLWDECGWNGSDEYSLRIVRTQQRGRVTFAAGKAAVAKLKAVTASKAKRTRNWSWVRGLFGGCGSLYIPKTGYYLMMRVPEGRGAAERMQAVMRSCGFDLGIRKRTESRELMLRDQQQIVTLLSRIGLVTTALELEETAIFRSIRNHANKLVNCDAANIKKSIEAAHGQLELIKKLEERGMTGSLPEPLLDLVNARKKNPSVTLKELGQTLPTPISKSTVEYRWRKLELMLSKHYKGDDADVLRKG
ncbi:MAG: DNA-binding protein WhiA [Synergistes sp.]|nr:DNA-binding protein WhiA [Synergistes sp.]